MDKTFVPKGKHRIGMGSGGCDRVHGLGRMATQIAAVLLGKNKPTYTPGVDTGDFVVVINASHLNGDGQASGNQVLSSPFRLSRRFEDG